MSVILFDVELFRTQCPEYADETKYPEALVELYWNQAILIMDDEDAGMLNGASRHFGLNMMVAHMLALSANIAKGKQGGFASAATVDKVFVKKMSPPAKGMLGWWLTQTPRGQELLVLLEVSTVGGTHVGGMPESSQFRKAYGVF